MSVAHDLDQIAEEKRKERARKLVAETAHKLHLLRLRAEALESGDLPTWRDARFFAQELIRTAGPVGLGLLVACAKEALYFADRYFAGEPLAPDLAHYMSSALDTVAMEIHRLQHDRDLQ